MKLYLLLSLFILSLALVSGCEEGKQESPDSETKNTEEKGTSGTTGKKTNDKSGGATTKEELLNSCNNLDEFKNCISQISIESSRSKTALMQDIGACGLPVAEANINLIKTHNLEQTLSIAHLTELARRGGKECENKPSNQEIKDCIEDGDITLRKRICDELAQSL